eukprot:31148-Pelagococcus_subviridis.AAC.4
MGGEKRAPGDKVLKDRRSPRRRGRTGTGARYVERAREMIDVAVLPPVRRVRALRERDPVLGLLAVLRAVRRVLVPRVVRGRVDLIRVRRVPVDAVLPSAATIDHDGVLRRSPRVRHRAHPRVVAQRDAEGLRGGGADGVVVLVVADARRRANERVQRA